MVLVTWCDLFLLSVIYAFLLWVIWCILFDVGMLSLYWAPATISTTNRITAIIIAITILIFVIYRYPYRNFHDPYLCACTLSEVIVRTSKTRYTATRTYRPWNSVNRTSLSHGISFYCHTRYSATNFGVQTVATSGFGSTSQAVCCIRNVSVEERYLFFPWSFESIPFLGIPLRDFAVILIGHTILGRTALDEWSDWRRDRYLTAHNTNKRQTSVPPAGFEPAIPGSERPQTHALDRVATGICRLLIETLNFYTPSLKFWKVTIPLLLLLS
jgi:hypothetical protein